MSETASIRALGALAGRASLSPPHPPAIPEQSQAGLKTSAKKIRLDEPTSMLCRTPFYLLKSIILIRQYLRGCFCLFRLWDIALEPCIPLKRQSWWAISDRRIRGFSVATNPVFHLTFVSSYYNLCWMIFGEIRSIAEFTCSEVAR